MNIFYLYLNKINIFGTIQPVLKYDTNMDIIYKFLCTNAICDNLKNEPVQFLFNERKEGCCMLLNTKTDIPEYFYIFVDMENPLTERALKSTGAFSSSAYTMCKHSKSFLEKYTKGKVRYLPYKRCNQDMNTFSPYYLAVVNEYNIEYDAERVREKFYPLYPSRLSAVYAFGDYDTCIKVSKKHNWDLGSVRRFKLIDDELTRVVRVNMEIVSTSRSMNIFSNIDEETKELLWKNYWTGLSYMPINPYLSQYSFGNIWVDDIFEYLIEGSLVIEE